MPSPFDTATVVGTTPTRLGNATARRHVLQVDAPASGTVYIGGPSVTSASGYAHAAGDPPWFAQRTYNDDPVPTSQFYAVTASGTATVRVHEVNES